MPGGRPKGISSALYTPDRAGNTNNNGGTAENTTCKTLMVFLPLPLTPAAIPNGRARIKREAVIAKA
ncbi:hypothetical protein D3C71_2208140 [compost metagenome]